MTIQIETLKISLMEQIAKDFEFHLPYVREHLPEQYPSRLLKSERTMQALIKLQSISQSEIDAIGFFENLNGVTVTEAVEEILEVTNKRRNMCVPS
ncbi:hypothetical protein ANSO36C_64880 (plasmid) [Nostoc cf. commune SO-36]|uniref:Uncharacterized protein n=1 Tax=Nostoc cf. commune SO-36 TaxID=449208 RepID=A0ABM7ZBM1_NOSCO|nr:hypothetical protein [Nostoc commune]BDI20686.1 hypothetical protein ANSO36C_64880 [Nostoc cf. commune SO-36]